MLVAYMHACMQESFLAAVSALRPDLCVTAAYGAILPQRFLDIPRLGTVNIHPSLLPKYVWRFTHSRTHVHKAKSVSMLLLTRAGADAPHRPF